MAKNWCFEICDLGPLGGPHLYSGLCLGSPICGLGPSFGMALLSCKGKVKKVVDDNASLSHLVYLEGEESHGL